MLLFADMKDMPSTPEQNHFLEYWHRQKSADDIAIIESDIFNMSDGIHIETLFDAQMREEDARTINGSFTRYLEIKREGKMTPKDLKIEAKRVNDYAAHILGF